MAHLTVTPSNESLAARDAIRSLKRGSRRGTTRKSPIDTRHWVPDHTIIAFPGYVALPAAANN